MATKAVVHSASLGGHVEHGIRRLARRGAFPVDHCGQSWPRAKFVEVEEWVRSTRIAPEPPPEGPRRSAGRRD